MTSEPHTFEHCRLWQESLAEQPGKDPYLRMRENLRNAYFVFRRNAALLAHEIARDLPDFTVHDDTHSDALWELAETIGGAELHLTPAEAFVLGGAFLIHDLGMAVAAYPGGMDAVRGEPYWRDSLAAVLRGDLGHTPSAADMYSPDEAAQRVATAETLRHLHAKHARRLAQISWRDPDTGEELFLLPDPDLRSAYGELIGRIAHSHRRSVDELPETFPAELGEPAFLSGAGRVDALKVACLLRLADAAHLDWRRAPVFLRAIRRPPPLAEDHWRFQQHLNRPYLEGDRLVFTSDHGFPAPEAASWWRCLDALRDVDREMRQVDAILADLDRPRLAARSVAHVDEPSRLARLIRTQDWVPVDTRLRVSDVAGLVRRLGGTELYGDDATVPLRELIQNAADAIRARRLMEDRPTDWGEISVRLRTSADSHWIEVQDNGIGMPPQVLAGPLLDFGISFWDSRLALELLPGIHAKGFEPTGKYGIGFFSVFMWGDEVTVISRPYAQSQSETRALEFRHGVFETPLLRPARADEILQDGGTLVRVKLAKDPLSPDGLLCPEGPDSAWALPELVAWLCPALDVTVSCLDEQGHRVAAVSASDWLILEGETLVKRVSYPRVLREEPNASGFEKKMRRYADRRLESLALLGQNLRIIKDTDGSPLGRACIAPGLRGASMWIAGRPLSAGVVVAGGLRATALGGIAGVLQGSCVEATRQAAIPDVDSATLAEWATEQALLLANSITDQEDLMEGAAVVHMCGGSTGPLPIATSADGAITATGIAAWAEAKREVLLVHEAAVSLATERHPGLVLDPDVLVIDSGPPTLLNRGGFYRPAARRFEFWPNQRRHESADAGWHWPLLPTALKGLVITLLARAWGLSLSAVLKSSLFGDDDTEYVRRVGKSEAGVLEEDVDVIRRAERRV